MIRDMEDSEKRYDHAKHRPQYDKLANFIVEFVQKKLVESYNLQEVWFPEDRHLEKKYHKFPKCNIFMSREFKNPNKQQNKGRRALVLI